MSPLMAGEVVAVEVPPPDGELTNVIWYWVTELKFTVCATVMVMVGVVNVVVWAMLMFIAPSRFQEASLVPVPEERPQTPLDETVRESPYLYQPSDVSEGTEYVTPLPPFTTNWIW
jgi:hypothetical protein